MIQLDVKRGITVAGAIAVFTGGILLGYFIHDTLDTDDNKLTTTAITADHTPSKPQVAAQSSEQAVVVMEPSTAFSKEQRDEITEKLIAPFIDFALAYPPAVVSMRVTIPAKKADTWEVFVTYADGTYTNFFYGNSNDNAQDWWIPVCDGGCNLSEQFKQQYPDIAAKLSAN